MENKAMTKEMKKIGTANDGTALMGYYADEHTRFYFKDDELVAVAFDDFDGDSVYYCLPGVWNIDSQTRIVNERDLARLAGGGGN